MKNGIEVVFTKDYANKKKDDKEVYSSMLASQLVRLKVARLKKASKKESK